jgi:hypothetical protein
MHPIAAPEAAGKWRVGGAASTCAAKRSRFRANIATTMPVNLPERTASSQTSNYFLGKLTLVKVPSGANFAIIGAGVVLERQEHRLALRRRRGVLAGHPESGTHCQSADGEQAGMGFDGVAGEPSQRTSQTKRLLNLTLSETSDRV